MNDLLRMRKRFTLWLSIMAAISLALLVYLLWPGSAGPTKETLQTQYQNLNREVAQWRSSNPEKTRADIQKLYAEDVPVHWSQISTQLEKLQQETGVSAQGIRYSGATTGANEKNTLPDVQRVQVDTTVTGDYAKVARFINALEQSKLLFIVDKISLNSHEGGTVSLSITFDTFLREAA
jgi:hypothetical protein